MPFECAKLKTDGVDWVHEFFELKEEVKRISEAVKFADSRLYELEKLSAAMFNALTKLVEPSIRQSRDLYGFLRRRKKLRYSKLLLKGSLSACYFCKIVVI